jgi:putative ABC transport system substrate-binding protein
LDELPALARELVSRNPDVLTAVTYRYIRALKQETTTIPIIMLATWEPVRTGLVAGLARPEGNITGVVWFVFIAKQVQLLKEIVPNLRQLAIIGNPNMPPEIEQYGKEELSLAASTLGFSWQVFQPVVANDYDEIFARIAAEHFDAAFVDFDYLNAENITRIIELALRHRIPAVSPSSYVTKAGLLLGYGQDYLWSVTRASEYVDKILRGAKPSDLPVEQAVKLLLTINLKTAKELGLTVPPSLLARADEVIE